MGCGARERPGAKKMLNWRRAAEAAAVAAAAATACETAEMQQQ